VRPSEPHRQHDRQLRRAAQRQGRLRDHASPHAIRSFVGARLHRRLFWAMGLTIFLTLGAAVGAFFVLHPDGTDNAQMAEVRDFFAAQFADSWSDTKKRSELAERARRAFGVHLSLRGTSGENRGDFGGACQDPEFSLPIHKNGQPLGAVLICSDHGSRRGSFFASLFAAGLVLWIVSGALARKMGRPLWDLVQVTREIGEGKLSSRARLGRHHLGEVGVLASSINEMASRIERQLSDQKELLAGVSHEIRTPLARLRVLTEILRDSGSDERAVNDAEREIAEIDDLIGRLLATSRLDFEALERRDLDGLELGRGALARLGLAPELLSAEGDLKLNGDATLLGRGLLNLLMNAEAHGKGPQALVVRREGALIRFAVEDAGPGFDDRELERVFESFYRGMGSERAGGSLGLGLALVRRIARAHGGEAFAENRATGGARVGFTVRVRTAPSS